MKRTTLSLWFFLIFFANPVFADSSPSDLTTLSLEDLMNLEVYSASKKNEPALRTPSAIYVITQEDIHRSGATNIPDLLRMVPGVDVQRVNAHSWDISARGFTGSIFANKLLVLIDGRAVYTPLFGGVFWDVQDVVLEDVERIEVIRGSGGTLWGANAVNGIINIITKRPQDTQGGLAVAGAGSEERGFGTLRYGGKSGDWFYRTYVKYFNRDEGFRANGTANDQWDLAHTGFRAQKDQWNVQGDFYQGNIGQRTTLSSLTPPFTTVSDKTSKVQGWNLLTKYEQDDWYGQLYWDATDRDAISLQERRDKIDLEYLRHVQATDRNEISYGLGYRLELEDIDNTETIIVDSPTEADQLFSLLLQDEFTATDRLKFTLGNKFEHNIYTGFEFEPSAKTFFDLNDHSGVWASASRAVRTPSRIEYDSSVIGATSAPIVVTRLQGNHDLDSEKMISYETGYRNQVNESLLLDISAFANHYDDLITFASEILGVEQGLPVLTYSSLNAVRGEVHGLEVTGDMKIRDWWKVKSSYTFTKLDLRTKPDVTNIGLDSFLENATPQHSVYVRSSFNLPNQFRFDPTLRYTDSYVVPSMTQIDINLSKTIRNWEIAIVGQNLLQDHHRESTASGRSQVERGGYMKVTTTF